MESVSRHAQSAVIGFEQNDALLRQVLESAAVGMVMVGVDRRLLYVNAAFSATFGYKREFATTLDVDALLAAEEPLFAEQIDRLIAGKIETYRADCRFRHSDGASIWMLAAGAVVRSETTGRPLCVILQLTDIDRQKRAEAALSYSESRWSYALESAGQGVWDHDMVTDTIYYSPMWRKMRGFGLDEVVDPAQEVWLARLHPDDRARINSASTKQGIGEDGFETIEYRERHRDGHYLWILSRGRPVEWDAEGRATRTIGTDTDITALKTTEAQLAVEKERLRVTLESIGDGVISTDAQSCVTFMNATAEEMTGWKSTSAIGRRIDEIFVIAAESGEANSIDPVAQALATLANCHIDSDMVLTDRGGTRRDIRASASPVRGPDGISLGAVLVFQDVTQSRAMQRELIYAANHDQLTGLPNRASFERALERAVAAKSGIRGAMCFIDLDRFKPINDGAGHAAGDEMLRLVGGAITACLQPGDFAARIGGDEFAVLIATDVPYRAKAAAQTLVDAIASVSLSWHGEVYHVGASAGLVPILPGVSELEVFGRADVACYLAKAEGGCRIVAQDGKASSPDK